MCVPRGWGCNPFQARFGARWPLPVTPLSPSTRPFFPPSVCMNVCVCVRRCQSVCVPVAPPGPVPFTLSVARPMATKFSQLFSRVRGDEVKKPEKEKDVSPITSPPAAAVVVTPASEGGNPPPSPASASLSAASFTSGWKAKLEARMKKITKKDEVSEESAAIDPSMRPRECHSSLPPLAHPHPLSPLFPSPAPPSRRVQRGA